MDPEPRDEGGVRYQLFVLAELGPDIVPVQHDVGVAVADDNNVEVRVLYDRPCRRRSFRLAVWAGRSLRSPSASRHYDPAGLGT